ncbi:MAG: GntR family transcriptional regulator [Trueperaceae bacterium]
MSSRARPSPLIRRDTVENQIYRSLRTELLEGAYEEGERLTQRAVAERMGTSRIPVRDALKRLEADGLLIKGEQGSYYCKPFRREDLEEVYSLRMLLEPFALRSAVHHLDPEAFRYLQELLQAMDTAVEEQDNERYVELNREFHMTIYEACHQPRLLQIIKGLWSGRPLFIAGDLGHTRSVGEHHDILAAIRANDVDRAAALLYNHVRGSFNVLRERLPERGTA